MRLSVRELERGDIDLIIRYWTESGDDHLLNMGVDLDKLPDRDSWRKMLSRQLACPLKDKQSYCLIWLRDDEPVGHCNINMIRPGIDARMHLHMWQSENRKKGAGAAFVRLCLPHFFQVYAFERIFCEPFALNPAPNKTLPNAGFRFVREYVTIPGFLNFVQPVNQWVFEADQLVA